MMFHFLLDFIKASFIITAVEVAHHLSVPATIIGIIVASAALIAALKTIWREVIVPPAMVLKRLDLIVRLFEGDDDTPGLVKRLDTLEDGQAEIIARISDGDEKFDNIEQILDVVSSEDRMRVRDALEAARGNKYSRSPR